MQSVRGSLNVSVSVMVRTQGSSGLIKEKKNRISTEKQKRTEKHQKHNRKRIEKAQKKYRKNKKNNRTTTEKQQNNNRKITDKVQTNPPPLPLLWNAQHV